MNESNLNEEVARLKAELAHAEEERVLLRKELQVESAAETIELVRYLRSRVRDINNAATAADGEAEETAAEDAGTAGLIDPRQILNKFRTFTAKIDSLNGTVSSMEDQLKSLYADRERLETEIGASEVDDVIAAFQKLQVTIVSMETQLMTLYAGREMLDVEIGKSDPAEIVAMFRNVAQLVQVAHKELAPSATSN
jgi:chromosome segregation ATPase